MEKREQATAVEEEGVAAGGKKKEKETASQWPVPSSCLLLPLSLHLPGQQRGHGNG